MLKKTVAGMLAAVMLLGISACGTAPEQSTPTDSTAARVASLKGATSLGLLDMMESNSEDDAQFRFEMFTGGDEIVPLLAKGEIDIALLPANLAATLYQKTDGGIAVIDINTLSVLEAVTANESVDTPAGLVAKTVYTTGKGTTPEYVLRYLLQQAGVENSVTVEFKTEATEVVSALAENPSAVGVLPQPFATAAKAQNDTLHTAFRLGDAWDQTVTDGSRQVTGVTVVRRAFLEEHPQVVQEFLKQHASSVERVNSDPAAAATLAEQYDIVKAAIAEKAIPACGLTCITGDEMKTALSGYLQVLYDMAPDSVGGKLPDEAFYYLGA